MTTICRATSRAPDGITTACGPRVTTPWSSIPAALLIRTRPHRPGSASFHSSPDRSFAVADLTPAYARQAHRVWRGLALVNRRQVLVQDEIDAGAPAEVWWFLHTPAAVQLSPDRRQAMLTQNGQSLAVRLLSPDDAVFEIRQARPLPLSPHPLRQSDNAGVQKLAIRLSQVRKVRLAVWFDPLPAAGCAPETIPAITPLADWH